MEEVSLQKTSGAYCVWPLSMSLVDVFWHGLKLSTVYADSETFQEIWDKVNHHLCSAQGHLEEATEWSADGYYPF